MPGAISKDEQDTRMCHEVATRVRAASCTYLAADQAARQALGALPREGHVRDARGVLGEHRSEPAP